MRGQLAQRVRQRVAARQFDVAIGRQHEQRAAHDLRGEELEQAQRGRVRPVQVVQDQQQRGPRGGALPEAGDAHRTGESALASDRCCAARAGGRARAAQARARSRRCRSRRRPRSRALARHPVRRERLGAPAARASRAARRARRSSDPTAPSCRIGWRSVPGPGRYGSCRYRARPPAQGCDHGRPGSVRSRHRVPRAPFPDRRTLRPGRTPAAGNGTGRAPARRARHRTRRRTRPASRFARPQLAHATAMVRGLLVGAAPHCPAVAFR